MELIHFQWWGFFYDDALMNACSTMFLAASFLNLYVLFFDCVYINLYNHWFDLQFGMPFLIIFLFSSLSSRHVKHIMNEAPKKIIEIVFYT